MSDASARLFNPRKAARPVRRVLAWFALVDEERAQRSAADAELAAMTSQIEALREEVARLEGLVGTLRSDFSPIEARTTAHTDLVVAEALRRAEAVDARLATDQQRLQELVGRLDKEHTAVLRLLSGDRELDPGAVADLTPPSMVDGSRDLFEEVERGSREEVVVKFRQYLAVFGDATPVLDLGCGRGEFLELAGWTGLEAYGVDADPGVVEGCVAAGLRAETADLFEHLAGLADGSLGGVFCAQVVEHLPPASLESLFASIARVLRPGGRVVIETPNAACFATYVQSFWRDPTHIRPVPAARLSWLARTAGLVVDDVLFTSPVPEPERLQLIDVRSADPELTVIAAGCNQALAQLNGLLYGPQDVALVATKP